MANYFDQFEVVEEQKPKQNNNTSKSYWDQFEVVGEDVSNNPPPLQFNQESKPKTFAENHPLLNNIGNTATNVVKNGVSAIGNVAEDIGNGIKNGLTQTGQALQEQQQYIPDNNGVLHGGVEKKSFLNDQRYWLKTKANNVGRIIDKALLDPGVVRNPNVEQFVGNGTPNTNPQALADIGEQINPSTSPYRYAAGSDKDYETLKQYRRNPAQFNTPEKQANIQRILQEDYNRKLNNVDFGMKVLDVGFWTVFAASLIPTLGGSAVISIPTLGGSVVKNTFRNNVKKMFLDEALKRGITKESANAAFKTAMEQGLVDKGIQQGLEVYSKNLLGQFGLNNAAAQTIGKVGTNAILGGTAAGIDMAALNGAMNTYTNYLGLTDNNPIEGAAEGFGSGTVFGATMGGAMPLASKAAQAIGKMPIKSTIKPFPNEIVPYKKNPNFEYGYNNGKGFYMFNDKNIEKPFENEPKQYNNAAKESKKLERYKNIAPNTMAKYEESHTAKNQELVDKIAAEGFDRNVVAEHIRKLENGEPLGQNSILHIMQARLYKAREQGKNNTFDELESLYQQYRKDRKEKIAELENAKDKNIITGLDENGDSQKYDVSDITNIKKVGTPEFDAKSHIYDDVDNEINNEPLEKSEKMVNNEDKGADNGYNERTVLQQSGMEEKESGINGKSDRITKDESEISSNISGIRRTDDTGLANGRRLKDEHKSLIETNYKNQHELNKSIENFINNKEYEVYDNELPEEVKSWLKKYAGAGGLEKQGAEGKGLLSEYYTPQNVVNKMWDLTSQYINSDGAKVLEPSVGIGRFLENAPKNTNFDVVEMNPVSAKITELLYPNANVTTGEFQERFIDKTKNLPVKDVTPEYDIVIGNPPYGAYSGKYKGLGEGKKFTRIESYFINRGLDLLKENGVMTFIVPSSFLDSELNIQKQEIGKKCELLDAYRLPEKTFDTTSIGTDIVVLRKNTSGLETNINLGKWFEQHPEKILGTVEERKNRFGKMEKYVKGDKNVVDNIDTSSKNIMETEEVIEKHPIIKSKSPKTKAKTKAKKEDNKPIEYNEYKHTNKVSEEDLKYYVDTRVDGSLPSSKYSPDEKVNKFNGKLYNDLNYLQGDIYEKLDALEKENISDKQKEIQRKKLESVLPKPKKLSEMNMTPSSDFVKEFPINHKVTKYGTNEEVDEKTYLDKKYLEYVNDLTNTERNGISVWDIRDYVDGKAVKTHYRGYALSNEEKANQRAEFLTKLKNTVDKTFNDFINSELSYEDMQRLENSWNRKFNNLYTPDYKNVPMIVRGLSDTFNGSKLKLQDVQVEGVNYLTNKGIGLLGFEVGVGKTLSGTIATVQNMQMGRCKKPLILVPKSVKPNWIREIHEAFPNIKINDVDNLSKFNGEIEDGSITVGTYQALDNLWYNDETIEKLSSDTSKIRTDTERQSTKRGREKSEERNAEFIGKALKGNKMLHKVEDLGFDHITVDEAHNFKNLFGDARADGQEGNTYAKITGAESTRAKRLFLLTQYILNNNNNRNVFMLTATPFNNSPLEVFNMLTYMAKDKLDEMGIYNVYQFMENYVDLAADWVVDSKNNVAFKQIAKGFKNLKSLQSIIDNCMLMRSADDAGIKRPNKITRQFALEPTEEQKKLIAEMEALAVGIVVDDEGNIKHLDKDELKGIQLKAITKGRIATLSPDIFNNNLDVSPEDFIHNSPKLNFIMNAIKVNKKKDKDTSQLIYMPIGTDFLPKIKQYLVNKGIYKADEIAIIQGGITDDKISSVTDSFNDRNGKIKVVIGTNKIKEGMNLNKNSSVLYIPFIDWNPTDYVQVVGRIWRRGNRYKNIRIIVPTLNDSSDSFMYQKLDEKTSRINNIMDRGKDYIDTGELNAAEEKINMITNPDKKALMFSQVENQKLENKKANLQGQLADVRHYKRELSGAKAAIKSQQEGIDRNTEKLKGIEDKTSWQYESTKNYLDMYKRDLKKAEKHLEYVENKIKRLELDFEGKDSEENIQNEIEKVQKEIENLKETTELKKAEYKDEYERNRKEGKKLEDYIAEFEKETDELLKAEKENSEYSVDIPEFMKDFNQNNVDSGIDIDLNPIYENISKGIKGEDLAKLLPDEIADIVKKDAKNYTFGEMITKDSKKKGVHKSKKVTIELNLAAIGNSPYQFIKTLSHELRHARQHKIYLRILAKPKDTWTKIENKFVENYNKCNEVNKELQKHYNKNRKLIDKFERNNFHNAVERVNAIEKLHPRKQNIIDTHDNNYENYKNNLLELDADTKGIKDAKGYRKESGYTLSRQIEAEQTDNRRREEWHLGANSQNSSTSGEYSIGQSEYKRKSKIEKAKELESARRSNGKAKLYVRQWHSNIEKDRYDVNKSLNTFIQDTKRAAKELSKSTGLKVTDKMVREIMPFLRERTEVPEELNRNDLFNLFNKMSDSDKQKLTKMADNLSDKFDKYYENYKDAKGIISENDIENHISHIWDLDKKGKRLLTNYFLTQSKFAKQRTIETLAKGIKGFEIDGEKVKFTPKILDYAEILKSSSDNLIKATYDSVLAERIKNIKNEDKIPLILPHSKAPADWIEINHPALNKAVYMGEVGDKELPMLMKSPVKVHPDIAKTILTVFETPENKNKISNAYDNVNSIYKQAQLGFSGFHMVALSESMVGNLGIKETLKLLNPKRIYDEVAKGNWGIYKDDTVAKSAIESGLQFGATLDLDRNNIERITDDAAYWLTKRIPAVGKLFGNVAKGFSKAQKLNNTILWDYLHNNYKLECYKLFVQELGKNKTLTDNDRREIAQWVNDSFGGQVWENLGIAPSQRRAEQRILLSPDWLRSTTRQFFAMFSNKKLANSLNTKSEQNKFWEKAKDLGEEWGINSLTGDVESSGLRGKLARRFWLQAFIYSTILYNVLNATFREYDRKKHPELYPKNMSFKDYSIYSNSLKTDKLMDKLLPKVFVGRNKDGSERMLRLGKQFREVPEIIENPTTKLGGKASPALQLSAQAVTGHTVGGYKNKDLFNSDGTRKNLLKSTSKLAAKSLMPYSVNDLFNKDKDFTAWSFLAPTSKGMTNGRMLREYKKAYTDGFNQQSIDNISNVAKRNMINDKNIKRYKSTAKSQVLKPYKQEYINAFSISDSNKMQNSINRITSTMEKYNIPQEEIQKIYIKAYKDYLKSLREKEL